MVLDTSFHFLYSTRAIKRRAVNSVGECHLDMVEVASSTLASPIKQRVSNKEAGCFFYLLIWASSWLFGNNWIRIAHSMSEKLP